MQYLVTITEPLGRVWTEEIVSLACPSDVVAARDAASGAWLPSQVTVGEQGDRRLAVRLSLAPGQPRQIACLATPTPGHDDLPFTLAEDTCAGTRCHLIANRRLAVAVPCSQAFNAGEAPGPVLSIRRIADAMWTGQGMWGPAVGCGRLETTVLERGALWVRWQTRYLVGGKERACYEMTLRADEDFVQVRERSALDAGMRFQFALTGADTPQYWCTHGGGEHATVLQDAVTTPPPRMGLERPEEFIHLDFHSGHQQMSYTWAGVWRDGGPLIGVTELHGGSWRLPGRNRITVYRRDTELRWHFPADGGTREYALVCGEPEPYAPTTGLSRFCHLRRKYSDLPLDKVRHWQLDWPILPRSAPLLYPAGTAECWREKAAAWPELVRGYAQLTPELTTASHLGPLLPAYLTTGETRLRQLLLDNIADNLQQGLEHALENGYLRLVIFSGRAMKVTLEAIDILRAAGELDPETERQFARKLAFLGYCFADPDFWPWDSVFRERGDPRAHTGVYWDDIGSSICPPNFTTEYYTSTGLFAIAYPEHPMAAAWTAWATELFSRNLDAMFFDNGGYMESANYHYHTQGMLVQLAVGLLAGGHRDFFAHPRFKANFGFFTEHLTPEVALTAGSQREFTQRYNLQPTAERCRFITNWGNSGHACGGNAIPPALAVAAGIYADRDPAYARRLMATWRAGAQQFCNAYWGFDLLALGRPDLPDVDLHLDSQLMDGLGAVMRAAQDTPAEIFAWVKCGPATHHNCNDEGGLVLYAHGAPLLGDFGYHTEHEGRSEAAAETWKHTCVTFGGKTTSFYLGVEQALPPQYWHSTPEADLLVCDLSMDYLLPEGVRYNTPVRVPHVTYTRTILFVKPRYFVIYDQIPQTALPSTWWLHALTDQIDIHGPRAHCHGRFGVDLDVQLLLPTAAHLGTGAYSVQRHLRVEQPGPGDYLAVIAPLRRGDTPPVARLAPDARSLTVAGGWGTDKIILSKELPLCLKQ